MGQLSGVISAIVPYACQKGLEIELAGGLFAILLKQVENTVSELGLLQPVIPGDKQDGETLWSVAQLLLLLLLPLLPMDI